jgi:hypothetical protein
MNLKTRPPADLFPENCRPGEKADSNRQSGCGGGMLRQRAKKTAGWESRGLSCKPEIFRE